MSAAMAHVIEEVMLLVHLLDIVEPDMELRDALSVEAGEGVIGIYAHREGFVTDREGAEHELPARRQLLARGRMAQPRGCGEMQAPLVSNSRIQGSWLLPGLLKALQPHFARLCNRIGRRPSGIPRSRTRDLYGTHSSFVFCDVPGPSVSALAMPLVHTYTHIHICIKIYIYICTHINACLCVSDTLL